MWFLNLKTSGKLLLESLVGAIMTAAVGTVGIIYLLRLGAEGNDSQVKTGIMIMVIVFVVGVAISIGLGTYISYTITTPAKKLSTMADMLSVGDLGTDSLVTKRDYIVIEQKEEMGSLARSIRSLIINTMEQVDAIKKVAEGNLTAEIVIRSDKDELGKSMNELVNNFHQLVSTIVTTAEQVASGSNYVSDSSMALSQGATEQASVVQQLTASLDVISFQTNLNAQNAEKANILAKNAKINAANGNDQMKEMLVAMDEINISSSNINKIIKVIDDIAFQTNILALNAAVEAARAGQHGKGFAVVAEEVRNLAARSASAAKETTSLIEGSIKKVEAGTKIANITAEALNQIVDEVEKAAELVSTIATSSKEQAAGIDQINQGIVQVSQVVQTNATTAEESAAASAELSSHALKLQENVRIFKLS